MEAARCIGVPTHRQIAGHLLPNAASQVIVAASLSIGAAILTEFVADPTATGVRLFNDDGTGNIVAGAAAGRSGMECTSCHDVHNGSKTQDVMLLRGKLVGSDQASGYICTQCHKK